MNISDKKELRRHYSEIRCSVKSNEWDIIIAAKLLSHERIKTADTVLLYASFKSEVDTWEVADKLLKKNIQLAFPKCGKDGIMTFHIVNDLGQLNDSLYGISEPDISLPYPKITDRTVCIVPGLAFTEIGERLGYGGGYYDRFLSEYPEIYTIALEYEKCIADNLPTETHDIKIKSIITEERTVLCNE